MEPRLNSPNPTSRWIAFKLASTVALAGLVASCSSMLSTPMNNAFDTRKGTDEVSPEAGKPRNGTAPLVRYYLPVPYIQVYAYEVRLLGRETLRIGFRPVVAPDTTHPILVEHNYGSLVEDNLQVTTSPEGLLEYVSLRREPKVVESAVAIGRAALSFAAPVPVPFKGDDGLPEFSRLIFKKNYLVKPDGSLDGSTRFVAAGRTFTVQTARLPAPSPAPNAPDSPPADVYQRSVAGFLHRPLMPIQVTVTEQPDGIENRSRRREIMRVEAVPQSGKASASFPMDSFMNGAAVFNDQWRLDFSAFRDRNQRVFSVTPLEPREADELGKLPNPPNTNHLVGVEFIEAPIEISDIVYIPDQNKVDTFFAPKPWFAAQSFEVRLAGGSVYDVRVRRKSEFLALANGLTEFAGGIVRVPANLFTFTVVHEQKSPGSSSFGGDDGGGSKDPGDYRKQSDKDPSDYRRKVDKE